MQRNIRLGRHTLQLPVSTAVVKKKLFNSVANGILILYRLCIKFVFIKVH